MRPHPESAPPRGSIRDDETLLFSEAARRLGLCAKSRRSAIRAGLRVVQFGRWQYTTGAWIRAWVEALAEQAGDLEGHGDV
jgi:hypothetical protein